MASKAQLRAELRSTADVGSRLSVQAIAIESLTASLSTSTSELQLSREREQLGKDRIAALEVSLAVTDDARAKTEQQLQGLLVRMAELETDLQSAAATLSLSQQARASQARITQDLLLRCETRAKEDMRIMHEQMVRPLCRAVVVLGCWVVCCCALVFLRSCVLVLVEVWLVFTSRRGCRCLCRRGYRCGCGCRFSWLSSPLDKI